MPSAITFSGQVTKRIKANNKILEKDRKQAQQQETPPQSPSALEILDIEERDGQATYQKALQAFIDDPTPVQRFLDQPLYQDETGDFTGRDLLMAYQEFFRKKNIINKTVIGTCLVLSCGLVHLMARKLEGKYAYQTRPFRWDFVNQFDDSLQDAVRDGMDEMVTLGLVKGLGNHRSAGLTELGQKALKNQI